MFFKNHHVLQRVSVVCLPLWLLTRRRAQGCDLDALVVGCVGGDKPNLFEELCNDPAGESKEEETEPTASVGIIHRNCSCKP